MFFRDSNFWRVIHQYRNIGLVLADVLQGGDNAFSVAGMCISGGSDPTKAFLYKSAITV